MKLIPERKKTVVSEVIDVIYNSTSVIAAYYAGLKSSEMTELRAQLRSTGVCDLKVVKNTLAKKAFVGTKCEQLINHINGPVILAFIKKDPGLIAKLLRDFSKEKEKLLVTALLIEGKLLNSNQLEAVANLPTKQEAITNLVIVIRAPIVKFVATLAEPIAKLTRTIAAIGKAK